MKHSLQMTFPVLVVLIIATVTGCAPETPGPESESSSQPAADPLAEALTFHASFDGHVRADRARGDAQLYTAESYDAQDEAEPGIATSEITLVPDEGRFGGALWFKSKNTRAVFYKAEGLLPYSGESSWSGTISFWLRLDPAEDLEPGFCDPIQITDVAYNDAAVWVDFTRENPRQFRLGVFGDLDGWNPEGLEDNPAFDERLVVVEEPPFKGDTWTHVVVTFEGLNSGTGARARLYLNGATQNPEVTGIDEPFTWDVARATVRLGVNYVGYFDELSLFDRALTNEEVRRLHELEGGVPSLY